MSHDGALQTFFVLYCWPIENKTACCIKKLRFLQYNKLLTPVQQFIYLFAQAVCRTYIQDAAVELDISAAPKSHSFQRGY